MTVDMEGSPTCTAETFPTLVGTWYTKETYGEETYESWYTFSEDGSYEEINIDDYESDYEPDTAANEGTNTLEGTRLTLIESDWYDTTVWDVTQKGSSMTWTQADTMLRAPGTTGTGVVGEWIMPLPETYEEYPVTRDTVSEQEMDPDAAEECAWIKIRLVFPANGTLEWRIPPLLREEFGEIPTADWSVNRSRLIVSLTCSREEAIEGMCRFGETRRDTTKFTVDGDYLAPFHDLELTKTTTRPDVPAEYYYKRRSLPAARGRPRPGSLDGRVRG